MLKKTIVVLSFCVLAMLGRAWAQTYHVLDTGDPDERVCNPKSYTELGNGIVLDNITGLMWQKDTAPAINWNGALSFCDRLDLGNYSDWRLPTIEELSTLVDAGRYSPAIDPIFSDTVANYKDYWSSTTYVGATVYAWSLYFGSGTVGVTSKSGLQYVRAVRGGPLQTANNFIDNGDDTITDTATGLMWQKATAPGTYTWQEALNYCSSLSLGGRSDWRLPTRNELQSLLDISRLTPATAFPNTLASDYWSSTTNASSTDYAWYVYFGYGRVGSYSKSYGYYVRAVRGGPCGGLGDWGAIRIVIKPTSASTGGAQWRVDGGAWHVSGATQSACAGQHTIEFSNVAGWLRPAPISLQVQANQTVQGTGTYNAADPYNAVLDGVVTGTNAQGGAPVPLSGVTVSLEGHGSQTTNSQGWYRFTGVAPGTYTLSAGKDGYRSATRDGISLSAGNYRVENFSIVLQSQSGGPEVFDIQSPDGRYFIPGMPGDIKLSAKVAWNGTPGTVSFLIDGQWHPATIDDLSPGLAKASVTLAAPWTIDSCSEVLIEATNGAGQARSVYTGIHFSPLGAAMPWHSGTVPWLLQGGMLSYSNGKAWDFDLSLPGDSFALAAQLGYDWSVKYDFSGASLKGSLAGNGGLNFKMPAHNPKVTILAGADAIISGSLRSTFAGCSLSQVTPSWALSLQGKAGVEAPAVMALDMIVPGVGTTLSAIPGVDKLKLKLYLLPGGSLSGVYPSGQTGDCLFGATSNTGFITAGLEAKIVAEITKNLKAGVYAGGQGQFDVSICPDLAFEGFGGEVYAGAFAQYYGLQYEHEISASIYWDFGASQASLLAVSDITAQSSATFWRPIGDDLLKWGEANRLATTPAGTMNLYKTTDASSTQQTVEQLLIENVITQAGPGVVANGSNVEMAFVLHSTDKPWYAASDIGCIYWTDGSDPGIEQVTDDLKAEFTPELLEIDENTLLAPWTRAEGDISGAETPEDIAPYMEIVASWFDRSMSQWSEPVQLTANSLLDRDPLPVRFGSTTGIIWVQNQGGALLGDALLGDSLLYSSWTGTEWSAPLILWFGQKGIVQFAFAEDAQSQGHIVLSIDEDGDTETAEDRELYLISTENDIWQTALRLTTDDVEDSLPVLVSPNDKPLLVWKSGESLQYSPLEGWNPQAVYLADTPLNYAPTLSGVTMPGGAAIAYSAQHPDGVDIMAAFYDAALDVWSLPRQLTHDDHVESSISMAFDGSELALGYIKTQTLREDIEVELGGEPQVIENVPQPGRSDLYALRHALGDDPAIESDSLSVEPANPEPGTQAVISATVLNNGDEPLENITVALYDADPAMGGEQISTTIVAGPLPAGLKADIEFIWNIPEDPNTHALFVVVDPDAEIEDRDRTNNSTSMWAVLPDVAVESVGFDRYSASQVALSARVVNQGTVPIGVFELSWQLGGEGGTEIGRSVIEGLDAGNVHETTLIWDYVADGVKDPSAVVYVTPDAAQVIRDFDSSNNGHFLEVRFGNCEDASECGGGYECIDSACFQTCTASGDCDDGVFCTGVESCADELCQTSGNPCDDGSFCNGAEGCVDEACVEDTPPCEGDNNTPFCDEACDLCVECLSAAHCDDGDFCNGEEVCMGGACAAGTYPCGGDSPLCDETGDRCVECLGNSDCDDDGQYCTGTPICNDGVCGLSGDPCGGATPLCDETGDGCVECLSEADCDDYCVANICVECRNNADCSDGQFCTGEETCLGGACVDGSAPCSGATPVCDETGDRCVECLNDGHCDDFCVANICVECRNSADCNDGQYCTGTETCSNGSCQSSGNPCGGETPGCLEATDRCVECTNDSHCDSGYRCPGNACVPRGTMQITKANVKAGKVRGADSIKFSGTLNATTADVDESMNDMITLTIEAAGIPDLNTTTFTFPINEATFVKGKYKSPKITPVNKTDPVVRLAFDTVKGNLSFKSKNLNLTGLVCPITVSIHFGDYAAVITLNEDVVNGPKKLCPPELML